MVRWAHSKAKLSVKQLLCRAPAADGTFVLVSSCWLDRLDTRTALAVKPVSLSGLTQGTNRTAAVARHSTSPRPAGT